MYCIRYVLALLLGLALSLGYAPQNFYGVIWVFPALLLQLIWRKDCRGTQKRRFLDGFLIAFLSGLGFWVRDVAFIGAVSEKGGWMNSSGLALYLSIYFGLYGGWAATIGRFQMRYQREFLECRIFLYAVMHGVMWSGLEWVRGLSRVSFGWDGLGVPLVDTSFAQVADVLGVCGLSWFPVFTGALVIQTLHSFKGRLGVFMSRVPWEVIPAVLILGGAYGYGKWRLASLDALETKPLDILLVQQNIPLSYNWDADKSEEIYQGFAEEMTTAFSKYPSPDIVMWPESSLPEPIWVKPDGALYEEQNNVGYFDSKVRSLGEYLFITGCNEFPLRELADKSYELNPEGPFYNAIAFFSKGAHSYEKRPKNHLMPFGEYMPLENFKLFQKAYKYSSGQTFGGSFTPAETFEPYLSNVEEQFCSIIPTVCYEDSVSSLVRKYVREEPQMIVNVTNDGWFAGTSCAVKHFQNARFRAIEYRRPLARAANTGVSGVVDIKGGIRHPETGAKQILQDSTGGVECKGHLFGRVLLPKFPVTTFYQRFGHLLGWGGGFFMLGFTLYRLAYDRVAKGFKLS